MNRPLTRDEKVNICMNCNLYHVDCTGERFVRGTDRNGLKKGCANRVGGIHIIPSPMQIEAFVSLYRAKRRAGTDRLMAFVEAIVQTSDDVFANVDQGKVDEYYLMKNARKARGTDE